MKFALTVIIVVVALQIFLAVSPFLAVTAPVWKADNPQEFYNALAALVGLQFTLITAAFGIVFLKESRDFRASFDAMMGRLSGAEVLRLRDDDFYTVFLAAAKTARHMVRISYFAPMPPDAVENRERKRYYEAIADLMRRQPGVRFKRLVRDSPQNAPWIASLVRDLEGKSNVDLAVLRRDVQPDREMPLALAVQIVDDQKVWFVAVASHEREGEYRDLYIQSMDVAASMTAYYNRLWAMSDEILRSGIVTDKGSAYLRRLSE